MLMHCSLSALVHSYIKNQCSNLSLSSYAPLQEHNEGDLGGSGSVGRQDEKSEGVKPERNVHVL